MCGSNLKRVADLLSKLNALFELRVEKILYVIKVFNFAIFQMTKLNWWRENGTVY